MPNGQLGIDTVGTLRNAIAHLHPILGPIPGELDAAADDKDELSRLRLFQVARGFDAAVAPQLGASVA